jgi:hypothetical protein
MSLSIFGAGRAAQPTVPSVLDDAIAYGPESLPPSVDNNVVSIDGIRIYAAQQSAKGYVGEGNHQARLMWGRLGGPNGTKVYFLEGRPQGNQTYRKILRDAREQPIGDGRLAETRLRELIRYEAVNPSQLMLGKAQGGSGADAYRNTWFYYLVDDKETQQVKELYRNGDTVLRLVLDNGTTASQPASLTVKTAIYDLTKSRSVQPLNATVRVESMVRTRVGTSLQYGQDFSKESLEVQQKLALAKKPIVDIISLNGDGNINLAGHRIELALQSGNPARIKAVMREALQMGLNISRRVVFMDPTTGQRTSFEIGVVAKAEGSLEAGYSNQPLKPVDGKLELEVYARWIGPQIQFLSQKEIAKGLAEAKTWVADMLGAPSSANNGPGPTPKLNVLNGGNSPKARGIITNKQAFGTPIWDLVPSAHWKNFGHPGLDLANRVNLLLRQEKLLGPNEFVRDMAHAEKLLQKLWTASPLPAQRQALADRLANPLGINFGLAELDQANLSRFETRTPYQDIQRKLFITPGDI